MGKVIEIKPPEMSLLTINAYISTKDELTYDLVPHQDLDEVEIINVTTSILADMLSDVLSVDLSLGAELFSNMINTLSETFQNYSEEIIEDE